MNPKCVIAAYCSGTWHDWNQFMIQAHCSALYEIVLAKLVVNEPPSDLISV